MIVTRSKLVIFSVAVAFVSVFFFAYTIQAVYPTPQYKNYCNMTKIGTININNITNCKINGGRWHKYYSARDSYQSNKGWCDLTFECEKQYSTISKAYERNIFFANLGVGILVFIIALFLGIESISGGLMGGSVMLIVYGSIRYWGELNNAWRALMLGVALSILIWLGYKKMNE